MSFLGKLFGGDGDDAAKASIKGAEIAAEGQEQALEYLKEREAIPQQFREEALTKMAGIWGLPGGEGTQEEFLEEIKGSPLYNAILSGRESGEEAIMRRAGATGGLRSGNVQENLYDYNVQLENRALLESWNNNLNALQGFAGLPSMAPTIAQTIAGIGETRGQGQIAAAQASQMGQQNQMGNIMGIANLGIQAYGSGMFSDKALKKNIKKLCEVCGFNWYEFEWNEVGEALGLSGKTYGCLADEVKEKRPDAVSIKDGFQFVNYKLLGIA